MLKNMFKSFILATKIYKSIEAMGLEEIENIDFQGCNLYIRSNYLTIDNCQGDLYKIPYGKINGHLIDRDEIYKSNRDFPDWVVSKLEDIYAFLKA